MSLTLSGLIDRLQEIAEQLDDDVDPVVRLATQQSWPLAFNVRGLALQSDIDECYNGPEDEPTEEVLWIVEGGHPSEPDSPYAPRDAWEVAQ